MIVKTVMKNAQNGKALTNQEIGVLMLHALDLLDNFDKLTQENIDRAKQNSIPSAA